MPGFSEKGLTFLGVRANLSWAHPPGHFDIVRCILNASTKVLLSETPLAYFVRQQKKNFLFNCISYLLSPPLGKGLTLVQNGFPNCFFSVRQLINNYGEPRRGESLRAILKL